MVMHLCRKCKRHITSRESYSKGLCRYCTTTQSHPGQRLTNFSKCRECGTQIEAKYAYKKGLCHNCYNSKSRPTIYS